MIDKHSYEISFSENEEEELKFDKDYCESDSMISSMINNIIQEILPKYFIKVRMDMIK